MSKDLMAHIKKEVKSGQASPLDVVIHVKSIVGGRPYDAATPEQVAAILALPLDFPWLTNATLKHEDGPQCEATLEWLAMFHSQPWIDLKRSGAA